MQYVWHKRDVAQKNQIPPRNNSMFYHKVSNTCQELPRLHETWETTYSPNPHPHHSKHSTRRQVCFLCLLAPSLGGPRSRVAWLPPSAATSILDDLENQPPGVSFLLWKWEGDSQASSVTHSPASRVMSVSCHALHGYANIWMSLEATPAWGSVPKTVLKSHQRSRTLYGHLRGRNGSFLLQSTLCLFCCPSTYGWICTEHVAYLSGLLVC